MAAPAGAARKTKNRAETQDIRSQKRGKHKSEKPRRRIRAKIGPTVQNAKEITRENDRNAAVSMVKSWIFQGFQNRLRQDIEKWGSSLAYCRKY